MDAVVMESVLIRVASKIFFKFVKNDYKLLLISFKNFCLSIIDWEMSFFLGVTWDILDKNVNILQ